MNCSNCAVNNLLFEFRVEGNGNESMFGEITEHLKRGGWQVDRKEEGRIRTFPRLYYFGKPAAEPLYAS